jgi:hypothetical protein
MRLWGILAAGLLVISGNAASADVFAVAGVAADGSAQTAAQARDPAVLDAQRRALRTLLERLTAPGDHARLPRVDDRRLATLVQSVEIQTEQSAAQRWSGQIAVRFMPDQVRSLLRGAGIPFTETTARPHLALPIIRTPAGAVLWEADNPWRDALKLVAGAGLVPLVIPTGDGADRATTAERAAAGTVEPALGERYRARVLIAQATGGPQALLVAAWVAGEPGERIEFRVDGGDAFRRAADELTQRLDARWKTVSLAPDAPSPGALLVKLPITSLADWVQVRAALGDIALIKTATPRLVSRSAVIVELDHTGGIAQLQAALAERDLGLAESDGEWVLSRGRPVR